MNYNNILVIKLSAIGDVIHTLPAVHALRQNNPGAKITWIVEKPSYNLLTNNPDIDQIIVFEKPKFKTLSGLIHNGPAFTRHLRERRFDLVVDFQGLFKSAAISLLSGAANKVGYCDMRELSHLISRPLCGPNSKGHVIERYLDVVRELGGNVDKIVFPISISENEEQRAEALLSEARINPGEPFVVLVPGTNWATKCWPPEHYAKLIDLLEEAGYRCVLAGGPAESDIAEQIVKLSSAGPANLTARTSLKELAHIFKRSRAFVGGDTGPMHLAVAVGTPAVTLFGPTDPARNGPYQGKNVILQVDRECKNCWKRRCDKRCLEMIQPFQVFDGVISVMRKRSP